MIVSVSRRTDIPAFYSEWFFNRLKEGCACAVNPFNRKQTYSIPLDPGSVDCFVFWTKDPGPMLGRLNELNGYSYYFQITLTAYGEDVEPGLRPKGEILDSVIALSRKIGKEKVVWRYDPVFINSRYSREFHRAEFESLAAALAGYTEKCVFSFMDFYKKTERNMRHLEPAAMDRAAMLELAADFSGIAHKHGIRLEACSEEADMSSLGIGRARCIDPELISRITGREIRYKKDPSQRRECGCAKAADIGAYDTCIHGCAYCYANIDPARAARNHEAHDPLSPLLTGRLAGEEEPTLRKDPGKNGSA
jgi:hypothetical protein